MTPRKIVEERREKKRRGKDRDFDAVEKRRIEKREVKAYFLGNVEGRRKTGPNSFFRDSESQSTLGGEGGWEGTK